MNFKTRTATFLSAVLAVVGLSTATDYTSWGRYRIVTVNTSAMTLGGTVKNIPVLVRFDATNHKDMLDSATQILANGADIRVTKADGTTDVPFEIETATTGATGSAAIWIKADSVTVNSASAATFRVYWNKTGATTLSAPSAVFDTTNGFVGVWHMKETGLGEGGTMADATVNAHTATADTLGTGPLPADTAGIAGQGKLFGGTPTLTNANGGYFQVVEGSGSGTLNLNTDVGQYTVSAWVKPNNCAGGTTDRMTVFSKYANDGSVGTKAYALQNAGSTGGPWRFVSNPSTLTAGGTNEFYGDVNACSAAGWQYVVGTYNSLGAAPVNSASPEMLARTRTYVNGGGTNTTGTANQTANTVGTAANVFIGRLHGAGITQNRFMRGALDEINVSKVARDSNWVEVSYETQRPSGGTAVSISASLNPLVASVPGAPTGVAGVAGAAQVTVSWAAPSSNGGATITAYKAMAVADTTKSCTTTGTLTCTITGLTNGTAYTFTVKATNSAGVGPASTASAAVTPAAYAGWTGHKSIILNTSASGANVPGTVTKFPLLVRLGTNESATLTAAKAGGADIRFSKTDDATALPYQIEAWSSTAATIWVQVDSVKGNNATQTIRMHWGNSAAVSESNGPAVFDTANGFRAVWHMNDSLNQTDASGKGNTATASSAVPAALTASIIGAGKTFDGATNWYQIGTDKNSLNLNTNNGPLTISAWVNPTSCDARIAAFSKYSNSNTIAGRQYALHTANTTTNWRFTIGAPAMNGAGDVEFIADAADACVITNWSQIVGTYASAGTPTADSAVNARIYVNGVLAASGTTASITGTSLGDSSLAFIGRIATSERYMNGGLDEITVSVARRDSNWVKLSYESQKALNTLTNVGSTFTVPGAPTGVTAAVSPTSPSGTAVISWTAPASNGGATITAYNVTGTPSGTCATTGALTCTVTGLTVGTSYTFTVKATNGAGQSVASAASTAVVVPTGLLNNSYMVHANGFARNYTFRLPEGSQNLTDNLSMTVTDVFGRTVWQKTLSPKETQSREISWNGKNSNGKMASAGIYIVKVKVVANGRSSEITRKGMTLTPGK